MSLIIYFLVSFFLVVESTTDPVSSVFPNKTLTVSCSYNFYPDASSVSWMNETSTLVNSMGVTITTSGNTTMLTLLVGSFNTKEFTCLQNNDKDERLTRSFTINCKFLE